MKVIVTGAGGMVGRAVRQHCEASGDLVIACDHKSLDISDSDRVMQMFEANKPDAVINCAAWTDVDGCELDHELAYRVNGAGPENLAKASAVVNATLVTISTDYVFDGKKSGFYTQADKPNPASVYGESKLDGERRAQAAHQSGTIVARTGFVFGVGGRNFLSTVVSLARRGEELKAISDSFGTPTYAWDLAVRLRELALLKQVGIFHVVNAGDGVSYEEFARAALDTAGVVGTGVKAITMDSLNRPAARPANSRLKCLTSIAIGLPPLPYWKDSLRDYVGLERPSSASTEVAARG